MNSLTFPPQFVGFCDEVLDIRFLGTGKQLVALATNSEQVKVFDQETHDCSILTGQQLLTTTTAIYGYGGVDVT